MRAPWLLVALAVLAAGGRGGAQEAPAAAPASAAPKRWVGRVQPPADPLDPWPLEPAPIPVVPPEVAPADTARMATGEPAAAAPVDSSDIVVVVQCRQILVSERERVPQLERLLRQGVPLEQALRTLGITEVDDSRRTYALDEIDPEVAAQIEAMPDSAWSPPRPWRGRTAFFQVLERGERGRYTVPRLGQNLDEKERSRLASQLRQTERSQVAEAAPEADYKPAAVVQQVPAEYPPAANESGEVTLIVEVGRVGEVLGVRVESSTARIFEEAALAAARSSTYRAAERAGFAEPGTVRLTYKFASPQAGAPPNP